MDETNKSRLVAEFTSLTGIDGDRANFYLDSANWDLNLAIQSFYDNSEDELPLENPELEDPQAELEMPDDTPITRPTNVPPNKDSNNNQPQPRTGSNIATLSSLQRNDDNTGGQAFYAGGSEHSGQQVLGPDGRKKDSDRIVSEMFKQAKENAEVIDRPVEGRAGPSAFTGSGFTLGSTPNDSKQILGKPSTSKKAPADKSQDSDDDDEIILKLWQNGFSLNDGPLRPYSDPQNEKFLAAIRRGEIPAELSTGRSGREVSLSMEDHRGEEYEPPKKKPLKAFAGEGHRLGTPASEIIAQSASSVPSDQASKDKAISEANTFLKFDQSQPNTKIQIRLADGSRMVVQINLARLISDLRQYICLARPEYTTLPFNLMTTFPNKVIENESASIQESGLANSSLVQRLV